MSLACLSLSNWSSSSLAYIELCSKFFYFANAIVNLSSSCLFSSFRDLSSVCKVFTVSCSIYSRSDARIFLLSSSRFICKHEMLDVSLLFSAIKTLFCCCRTKLGGRVSVCWLSAICFFSLVRL